MESSKLLRLMIVAASQESGEEFARWLTDSDPKDGIFTTNYKGYDLKAYIRWPGCPRGLPGAPANDALIIRVQNSTDWKGVCDYVREKNLIQFKLIVWDEEIASMVDEVKPNIVMKFSEKNSKDILDELIKAENDLDNLLRSVFTNIDKSGDGFINLYEMETMCRELGIDVTHSDFQQTLRSLDVNHDNKISLEEYTDWYKNGRQSSKLMENLILMRISTSSFLNGILNSPYLNFIKEKVASLNKEKKELVNSFLSINLEQVSQNPELVLSFDGYFGGEFKETVSKSYTQYFEESLKPSDIFFIIEFRSRDPAKTDFLQKFLTNLLNLTRESFIKISRKIFSFINNDVSIKVIKKNEDTICLSFKMKKTIKVELASFENSFKSLLDDEISQKVSLSFCLSGNLEKVKINPTANFLDSFEPASSLEIKTEILKKNLKLIIKSLKPIPRILKLWLNSFGGAHINLNFNLNHVKRMNNSLLQQQNQLIIGFVKTKLEEILQDVLSTFGGYNLFKKFYDSVINNYTLVFNTSQLHATANIELSGSF